MTPFNFLARVFSDNGEPSFSRVGAGLALSFSLGWVTCIVKHTYTIPDLGGVTLFISTLYALNVVKTVLNKPNN